MNFCMNSPAVTVPARHARRRYLNLWGQVMSWPLRRPDEGSPDQRRGHCVQTGTRDLGGSSQGAQATAGLFDLVVYRLHGRTEKEVAVIQGGL